MFGLFYVLYWKLNLKVSCSNYGSSLILNSLNKYRAGWIIDITGFEFLGLPQRGSWRSLYSRFKFELIILNQRHDGKHKIPSFSLPLDIYFFQKKFKTISQSEFSQNILRDFYESLLYEFWLLQGMYFATKGHK